MSHILITAIVCVFFGILRAPAWTHLMPAVWYLGREFAQAEYRYIAAFCNGKRALMPAFIQRHGMSKACWTGWGRLPFVCFAGGWRAGAGFDAP